MGGLEIKKAGARVVGWSPPIFFLEMGGASSHPSSPHLGEGNWGDPISPHPRHHPISPHIDEDALEGLYFAFFDHPKVFALLLPKNAS